MTASKSAPVSNAATTDGLRTAGLVCAAISLFLVALRGGMPGDRVNAAAPGTGLGDLVAVPAAVVFAVLGLVLVGWQPSGRGRIGAPGIGFCGLLIWAAVSLVRSHYLSASVTTLALLAAAAAVGAAIVQAADRPTRIQGMALVLVTAASVVAGLGLSEYAGQLAQHNPTWRVFSTFASPNFLAGYLAMTVPVSASLFLAARDRYVAVLAGLGMTLQAACLLLTGSRFGLAALAVALVAFAILTLRAGVLAGTSRRRAMVLLGVGVLVLLAGFRPVLHRLLLANVEAYSSRFRIYTWRGAARMAAANPVLGTGIGTFDTEYPRYALVGYTEHAHDSYLQVADETGLPGALLLLIGIAGVAIPGIRFAFCSRGRAATDSMPPSDEPESAVAVVRQAPAGKRSRRRAATVTEQTALLSVRVAVADPRLILAGLLAGLAGALVRNLFDSDLYVPANALTFAAICGLVLAAAQTDVRRAAEQTLARAAQTWIRVGGVIGTALALAYAVSTAAGRLDAMSGESASRGGDLDGAIAAYRSATAADPFNPEYPLSLAVFYESTRQPEDARRQYQVAMRRARIGKCFYRYGRFLERSGDEPGAAEQFARACVLEPGNLQSLLALAEAYRGLKRTDEADAAYGRLAALYESPNGKIRALPEMVPWEFGAAFLGLAQGAQQRGDLAQADRWYSQADKVFAEFWAWRDYRVKQTPSGPELQRLYAQFLSVGARYDGALSEWGTLLRRLGRLQQSADVDARRQRLEADMAAYRA